MNASEQPLAVGSRVFWWTGRGSQGHGVIRAIKGDRYLIDPEPDAIKGSDFRTFAPGSRRRDVWVPRDYGVPMYQINTPPRIWYTDG